MSIIESTTLKISRLGMGNAKTKHLTTYYVEGTCNVHFLTINRLLRKTTTFERQKYNVKGKKTERDESNTFHAKLAQSSSILIASCSPLTSLLLLAAVISLNQ